MHHVHTISRCFRMPSIAVIAIIGQFFFMFAQEPIAGPLKSVLEGPIAGVSSDAKAKVDANANTTAGEATNAKKLEGPSAPKASNASTSGTAAPVDAVNAGSEIDAMLTALVLEHLPHDFSKEKNWGDQKERFDGLKVRRDGFNIRTKRKRKMANHGNWKKYSATLVDPETKFSLSVKNMREIPDERMAFDLHCGADLKIDGRISKWVKGVQLYSLSVDGKATVSLVVTIELETVLDLSRFPPDLVFRPRATAADLEVEDFRIDRISKVGGEVAQQVTAWVRAEIDEKIAGEEVKLVQKINRSIEKESPKMRLSLHDALSSKWAPMAQDFLPAEVREAAADEK